MKANFNFLSIDTFLAVEHCTGRSKLMPCPTLRTGQDSSQGHEVLGYNIFLLNFEWYLALTYN